MEKKRSVGLTVCGIFLLLCIIPASLTALIAAISGPPPETAFDIVIRIPFIASPIFLLISAIGLFLLRNWGRLLSIIVSSIMALTMIFYAYKCVETLSSHPEWASSNIPLALVFFIAFLLFTIIIIYLTSSKIKEQFACQESSLKSD